MEFTVGLEVPFNLDYTLDSGQAFRWERRGEWWYGVVTGGVLRTRQEGELLRCVSSSDQLSSAFVGRYFRLDEPLEPILASIMKGPAMSMAIQRYYGLRLVRQERWECMASFILATNANIPRIKKMVSAVCNAFGDGFEFEGELYHSFPGPEAVAQAKTSELEKCGLGYRAPFLKHAASSVASGKVDLGGLDSLGYEESHRLLVRELRGVKSLLGVGPKVADCTLLYSCDKDEAFPIDVWMLRALRGSYPRLLGPDIRRKLEGSQSYRLTPVGYAKVSKGARRFFGRYAGYAQLYLYAAARSGQL